MNQTFMFTFIFQLSPSRSFCIFVLFVLSRAVLAAVDPFYEACVPKTCGDDQIIKFPFYIEGQQEPFCGYPGFQLSCNNKGNPVLNLHNIDYIIHQIFYNNQSLRISNAAVSEPNVTCNNSNLPVLRNISLPEDRFTLISNQIEVVLLYNCNSSLPEKFLQYKVCENKTNTVLALYNDSPNLGNASKECTDRVVAPVDVHGPEVSLEIVDIIRRGFLLNWTASNCSVCEESGGKCGFNASTFHFKCYCPDRPHAQQCYPETKSPIEVIAFFIWIMLALATWVPCWAHLVHSSREWAKEQQPLLQKSTMHS